MRFCKETNKILEHSCFIVSKSINWWSFVRDEKFLRFLQNSRKVRMKIRGKSDFFFKRITDGRFFVRSFPKKIQMNSNCSWQNEMHILIPFFTLCLIEPVHNSKSIFSFDHVFVGFYVKNQFEWNNWIKSNIEKDSNYHFREG